MESVKHLVISGGALKGIAFLGVIECLQRKQNLRIQRLQTMAGSSVGAIIATLLLIGFSVAELYQCIVDMDLTQLSRIEVPKLVTHFGLDSGRGVVDKLRELFIRRGIDPTITFEALYRIRPIRLVMAVTCLGEGVKYLDYQSHPTLSVIGALRMSFAIPLVFTAVRYQNQYYVDGGLLDNCPVSLFSGASAESVLVIKTSYESVKGTEPPQDLETFFVLLMCTMLNDMEKLRSASARSSLSTITVKAEDMVTSQTIALTTQDKHHLFSAGYKAAQKYLDSDKYLTLRIQAMPHHIMRNIWQSVHKRSFNASLQQINQIGKV